MFSHSPRCLVDILVVYAVGTLASVSQSLPDLSVHPRQWDSLNKTVGGRLHLGTPVSLPCFSRLDNETVTTDQTECVQIQGNYLKPDFRSSQYGAYMQTQWETCQQTSQQCLLDSSNSSNPLAFNGALQCSQGSISPHYIDVREASDVQAAYSFSQSTGVPLVIKNSGHDYKGRSSGIGSLGVWTHNLNAITHSRKFVPEGCTKAYNAMTMGSGTAWQDAYAFADSANVTIIGAYHQTVGTSGGWVMGGGHSVLSPVYGLGVDRVVQFKVVTPDGVLRTANACKNSDLFWALRGGGGGTFGVVLESTQMVESQVTLQVANIQFTQTSTNMPDFYKIVVENSLGWGEHGWGGHVQGAGLIYVTPLLNLTDAKASMKPLTDWVQSQNGTVDIETMPSWFAFFQKYVIAAEARVGTPETLGTRLIPATNFKTEKGRSALLSVLVGLLPSTAYIPVVAPILYNATEDATSVTPTWRKALWHFGFNAQWQYNTTLTEEQDKYRSVSNITQSLRDITPGSGSYQNECDLYEPDHETSFWGDNYARLLRIKKKYDPHGLLDCWQCVGWTGPSNHRYRCYLNLWRT